MKKGFTLVELLGVIVVLTLILVLVYEEFAKQVKVAKQQSYDRQVTTIINVAKDYHLQNPNEEGVLLYTLESSGLLKTKDMKDPRNDEIMDGCVVFDENEYRQIQYTYNKNLSECTGTYILNGYARDNLILHYDAKNNGGIGLKNDSNIWKDLSENNNDGTLVNFGSTSSSGWQSDSLAFDGSDDGVSLENKLSNIFKADSTIEIVVKFNDSSRAILFGNFSVTNNINLERMTNNKFRIYWNNGSPDISGTTVSQNDKKYLLSFVNDKIAKTFKLYINGILNETFTNSNYAQDSFNWNSAYIGRDSRTGTTVLYGNIYSVRMYNNNLTDEQILKNYMLDKAMYEI